jgi:hypothetical protein
MIRCRKQFKDRLILTGEYVPILHHFDLRMYFFMKTATEVLPPSSYNGGLFLPPPRNQVVSLSSAKGSLNSLIFDAWKGASPKAPIKAGRE